MGDVLDKSLQEFALETFAQRFANMLGVDNIPIVWNANPKRTPQESGNKPTYPIMYLNVGTVARNEHIPFKRMSNVFQLGYVAGDGTRKAIKLTPIQVTLRFFLKTDDYRQAFNWATDLVINSNTHEDNSQLSFELRSPELGDKFVIPNQAMITSSEYPITEVEYSEDVMEYSIDGDLILYTRASQGKFIASLIPTYGLLPQVDPENAIQNVDGSTSALSKDPSTNRHFPIRVRSNLDD